MQPIVLAILLGLLSVITLQISAQPLATIRDSVREDNMVVVELFTSQGCSSCPPADRNLSALRAESLAHNVPVLFIGWHVDYWDYLGWRDPYGRRDYSNRQRRYARVFGSSTVYTPQMIVNGKSVVSHAGNREAILTTIGRSSAQQRNYSLQIDTIAPPTENNRLIVTYRLESTGRPKTPLRRIEIGMLLLEDGLFDTPTRGENGGVALRNDAVVRDVVWKSAKESDDIRIAIDDGVAIANSAIALIAQDKGTQEIFAATSRALKDI